MFVRPFRQVRDCQPIGFTERALLTHCDIDINSVEVVINKASDEIKRLIQQQSRPVVRECRFLLFPEQHTKEYYTVIFRLIMWLTLVCMGVFLFSLSKQALENSKLIKLRQLENNQYKNTWKQLYNRENKQGKKKMDDAWEKSLNEAIIVR